MNYFLMLLLILLIILIKYTNNSEYFSEFLPTTGAEPIYDPDKWNKNKSIKKSHNCYSYFLDDISDDLIEYCEDVKCKRINPQPGHYSGMTTSVKKSETTCPKLIERVKSDNPMIYDINFKEKCKDNYYKGALAVDPLKSYHFYRQNKNGYFSHKDGSRSATNIDASGNKIKDVRSSNRKYNHNNFSDFCGYMCIPSNYHQKTNMGRRYYDDIYYKS